MSTESNKPEPRSLSEHQALVENLLLPTGEGAEEMNAFQRDWAMNQLDTALHEGEGVGVVNVLKEISSQDQEMALGLATQLASKRDLVGTPAWTELMNFAQMLVESEEGQRAIGREAVVGASLFDIQTVDEQLTEDVVDHWAWGEKPEPPNLIPDHTEEQGLGLAQKAGDWQSALDILQRTEPTVAVNEAYDKIIVDHVARLVIKRQEETGITPGINTSTLDLLQQEMPNLEYWAQEERRELLTRVNLAILDAIVEHPARLSEARLTLDAIHDEALAMVLNANRSSRTEAGDINLLRLIDTYPARTDILNEATIRLYGATLNTMEKRELRSFNNESASFAAYQTLAQEFRSLRPSQAEIKAVVQRRLHEYRVILEELRPERKESGEWIAMSTNELYDQAALRREKGNLAESSEILEYIARREYPGAMTRREKAFVPSHTSRPTPPVKARGQERRVSHRTQDDDIPIIGKAIRLFKQGKPDLAFAAIDGYEPKSRKYATEVAEFHDREVSKEVQRRIKNGNYEGARQLLDQRQSQTKAGRRDFKALKKQLKGLHS